MTRKRVLYGISRTITIVKDQIHLHSWLERGKLRKQVFYLVKERTTPSSIVEKLTKGEKRKSASHYAQVSRALQELEIQGLVTCLTPKEKTGRLYALTEKGKKLQQEYLLK